MFESGFLKKGIETELNFGLNLDFWIERNQKEELTLLEAQIKERQLSRSYWFHKCRVFMRILNTFLNLMEFFIDDLSI